MTNKFADLLVQIRSEKKMLKKEVAYSFGWTPMYYGRYENGQLLPTEKNIDIFSSFMGIPVDILTDIVKECRKISKNL